MPSREGISGQAQHDNKVEQKGSAARAPQDGGYKSERKSHATQEPQQTELAPVQSGADGRAPELEVL
jgi:hypothetical protein